MLALQGDFQEHADALTRIGAHVRLVKLPAHLKEVDRLIIPGGESTAIGKLLKQYRLLSPIRARAKRGMPIWGTCAGAILLAKRIADGQKGQPSLKLMDVTARRNAFGRQLQSHETKVPVNKISVKPLRVSFIRAPILERAGRSVEVLALLPSGGVIAAQQGKLLATCFHTELAGSDALHRYFLSL